MAVRFVRSAIESFGFVQKYLNIIYLSKITACYSEYVVQATVLNAAVGNFGASGADRKNRLLRYVSVAKLYRSFGTGQEGGGACRTPNKIASAFLHALVPTFSQRI